MDSTRYIPPATAVYTCRKCLREMKFQATQAHCFAEGMSRAYRIKGLRLGLCHACLLNYQRKDEKIHELLDILHADKDPLLRRLTVEEQTGSVNRRSVEAALKTSRILLGELDAKVLETVQKLQPDWNSSIRDLMKAAVLLTQ